MKDLENTYLRVSLITNVDHIHNRLRNIFLSAYDEARSRHLVTKRTEDKSVNELARDLIVSVNAGKTRNYNEWLFGVSSSLCKYLNLVYSHDQNEKCGVHDIVTVMEEEFYIEPTLIGEGTLSPVTGARLGSRNSIEVTPGELLVEMTDDQYDAIDELFEYFDAVVTSQRELYDRYGSKELIKFSADRTTGFIFIEFWGDVRVHLYNELMSKGK